MKTYSQKSRGERAQVLVEYVIMLVMCVLLAAGALLLLKQMSKFGWWLLELIGIGYP